MSRRWSPGLGRAGAAAGSHPPPLEAWTWGKGLQNYPFCPLGSHQHESFLGTETKSDPSLGSCCPGPGVAHREPGNMCACVSSLPPTQLPTVPAVWCSFRRAPATELVASVSCRWEGPTQHRLGTGGLGQQVDVKEDIPMRKDMMLPPLPLTQPTRVAARTQKCSCQIQRPPHTPQVLWAQQPTGLQKAPSPGEIDTLADPSTCPGLALSVPHSPVFTNDPAPGPLLGIEDKYRSALPAPRRPRPQGHFPDPTTFPEGTSALASCLTHTDPKGRCLLPKSL